MSRVDRIQSIAQPGKIAFLDPSQAMTEALELWADIDEGSEKFPARNKYLGGEIYCLSQTYAAINRR